MVEAAAPGEELVGGAVGDVALCVEACGLQVGDRLHYALGTFLASAADEYTLDLFRILDLVREVYSSAHQPVIREHLGTGKGDCVGLHTAH